MHVNNPASELVYSERIDLCICVSVYIFTDCLSKRVYMLMHVSACVSLLGVCFVCFSCIAVPLPRWANGADHCGNHGGTAQVAPGDERLHRHLWTA